MVRSLLVVIALFGLSAADSPDPPIICDNATLHVVPACVYGCPPEITCQNRNWPPLPCANPGFPCTEKCICAEGYARNKDEGTCVTLEQCDKCPGENEYFQCDGDYDEQCVGHCYCYSGYTRDINDKCVYVDPAAPPKVLDPPTTTEEPVVTTEAIKDPPITCDNATLHEVRACVHGCPIEKTCQNRNWPPMPCAPPRTRPPCTDKCVYVDPAAPPKVLDPPTTTEVPIITTEATQGIDLNCNASLHEVPGCVLSCPPQRTCQNFRGPEPPCVPPTEPCKPQCVCADGYARNHYGGTCVTFAQCDKCPGYSQYFACDGDYSDNCDGSCYCADGYKRDSNNTCVSTYVPPPIVYNPPPPPTGVNPTVSAQPPHPKPHPICRPIDSPPIEPIEPLKPLQPLEPSKP